MSPHSDSILTGDETGKALLGAKDFTGLTSDSRAVKPGYLFAALSGTKNRPPMGTAVVRYV